ncbi:DUF6879 family protein [Sphaerisporangium sp. NPDC005289]|uniref:DUF6879 family protein n=1 Tax=Sphaerisporangium sp. NPDC005289 TaxID=3155247 RepID=UPI0033A66FCF
MIPPEWATRTGKWLTLDEFGQQFSKEWSRIGRRFLKLECWQAYQELDTNRSQEAYRQGDVGQAMELLREEAETDRPLYDDIRSRGIEYSRIRLVQEPLSAYLRYELLAYQIRANLGEVIEVVRYDTARSLPNEDFFDFLLFDRHAALIHDYGAVGSQAGGWLTHAPQVLASLESRVAEVRQAAVPLEQYLAAQ